jgi:poly(glycerol-phosphate) alpha-glucosyltransferase
MNAVSETLEPRRPQRKLAEATQPLTRPRRILDVWAHVDPRFGGVGPAAACLANAVGAGSPWRSEMVAVCDNNESERHGDIPETVRMIRQEKARPFADIRLAGPLKQAIERADVCHIHGIWLPHSVVGAHIARQLRKPVVFSAHGMLESWDLRNKRFKKELYSRLFQRRALRNVSCLRALSEQEASDYRSYGLDSPIAIVPNGVAPMSRVSPEALLEDHPELSNKQVVLFLSRIHRKKGILELLQAWPSIVRKNADAHLLVAGADFENTGETARQMVESLGIRQSVTFCGVLNGIRKLSALSLARLFCLPSYSEGMSVAVLEALSIGLPVVITKACNVDGVADHGAGYVISAEVNGIADSISAGLSLQRTEWLLMSEAAQALARSRYGWSQIGDTMRSVYEWLAGDAPQPDCILR